MLESVAKKIDSLHVPIKFAEPALLNFSIQKNRHGRERNEANSVFCL